MFPALTMAAFALTPASSTDFWLRGYFADPTPIDGIGYVSNQSVNGVIVRLLGASSTPEPRGPLRHPDRGDRAVDGAPGRTPTALVGRDHGHGRDACGLAGQLGPPPDLRPAVARVAHTTWVRSIRSGVLGGSGSPLTAVLLLRVIWLVPNTHDREYPHTPIQFLLGDSDILLRLATLATLVWILRTTPTETVDVAPPPR